MTEIEKFVDFDGTTMYYKKGTKVLHREDGPAVVFAGGNQYWYKDGELHREDGPAAEYEDGDRVWYIDGKLHRENGPAVDDADGYKAWYLNGLRHRDDGPAIKHPDGTEGWYLNGEEVTEEEVMGEQLDKVVGEYGAVRYFKKGTQTLHREDGPAVDHAGDYKAWYQNGKRHREDGPAVELADGTKEWYLNGEQVSENEFNAINGDVSTELKIISNVYIIEFNGEEIICRGKEELNKMIDHLM